MTHSKDKTYLVTGVNSGLGKYLHRNLPGSLGLTRSNREHILDRCEKIENLVILHCAYNSKRDVQNYSEYLDDNVFLTMELLSLPHTRFVYFSSVDVYGVLTPYSFLKRAVGDLVATMADDYLILKLPAILGPDMRKNSLVRILDSEGPLTLSSASSFNYVLQSDILTMVAGATATTKVGEYDFVSATNVTLEQIAARYNKEIDFGEFTYETNLSQVLVENNIHPHKERTSLETIELFLEGKND
jgi:nucleoside-diphosphate-sugar epimerase